MQGQIELGLVVQNFTHSSDFKTIKETWDELSRLSQHIVHDEKKYFIEEFIAASPMDVRLIQLRTLRALLDNLEKSYVLARTQRYSAHQINWKAFSYWS